LQGGISHNLGQNFAKAFDIRFEDQNQTMQYAWTTSWGTSTRNVGALIMTHGDDSGLILPPRVAPYQAVIIPIAAANWQETILPQAQKLADDLRSAGLRIKLDDRDAYTPGWKYSEWEMRGVPVRIEIGPKDIAKGQIVAVRRDNRAKEFIPMPETPPRIRTILDLMQQDMFNKAKAHRDSHIFEINDYAEFKKAMEKTVGFVLSFWCGSEECEAKIKEETAATIRVIPQNQPDAKKNCVFCGKPGRFQAYFAKAY